MGRNEAEDRGEGCVYRGREKGEEEKEEEEKEDAFDICVWEGQRRKKEDKRIISNGLVPYVCTRVRFWFKGDK